jgi:uncharacterized protein (TIGR01777 family)
MSLPSLPYLLSGASGMLGKSLQQLLEDCHLPILQLVRRNPALRNEIQWNPAVSPAIQDPRAFEGMAAAIHLGGASLAGRRWTKAYKRELVQSRIHSTRELASTLARLRQPPPVFLTASAVGFYGNRGDELLDDTSPGGSGFLAEVCQQWEAAALPAVEAGIRVIHLRLGVVLGPGSGALAAIAPLFRLGLGGRLGSGRQWMSWISLTDAVAAIAFALRTPSIQGPINLTSPNPVTNRQFTLSLAHVLHRPAVLPVPAFVLRLALGEMADEALLSSARAFPSKLTTARFQFKYPVLGHALAAALAQPE